MCVHVRACERACVIACMRVRARVCICTGCQISYLGCNEIILCSASVKAISRWVVAEVKERNLFLFYMLYSRGKNANVHFYAKGQRCISVL